MAARRITVDPRTVQQTRYAGRRVLEPEVRDDACPEADQSGDHERLEDAVVRAALARARGGARILDVGSGTGAMLMKIAGRRADVVLTGVDLSETMIRIARERVRAARLTRRIHLRLGSARRLPFNRSSFDLVLSSSLLHHLADPVPAFDEFARVLAPGGRVLIVDLRRPGPSRIASHIRRHTSGLGRERRRILADSVRAAFRVAEVKEMLKMSRLRGCRVRPRGDAYLVVEGRPRRFRR